MKDEDKTRSQLIAELQEMRSQIASLTRPQGDVETIASENPFDLQNLRQARVITQRKQMEQALRESEERLELAVSGANEGIWDWYIQRDEVYFDDRYYTMAGYEPGEFPGTFNEFERRIHAEDIERTNAVIDDYLAGKLKKYKVEFRFLRKDGIYMWILAKGKIVSRDGRGNPLRFVGIHADITERKQMEESLCITQFSFDNAPVGIYRIGPGMRILDVNHAAVRMLGYSRDELVTMAIWDIDPYAPRIDDETARNIAKERKGECFESLHRRKDGHEIPVEINSNLFEYGGQKYAISFVQDITERKQAGRALRENEQLLSNILESMDEIVAVLDQSYTYQLVNKKHEEASGKLRREMMGKTPWEVWPHLKNTTIEHNVRKAMKGGVISGIETQVPNLKGNVSWVKQSFSPLKDADGSVIGVVAVSVDITGQKQNEAELSRLRNYLSNIIDSMPSVLVGVDSQGTVTQWNRRAGQVTGISSENAVSRPLDKVFPRLSHEMDSIRAAIRDRRVIRDAKVLREDREGTRYEDITIFPLVANGVEGAVIRVDDVTDQVRMEEMMIQSEKMLSVGGLAAGMAHEINNPLAGMLQTAQVMARRLKEGARIPANRKAAEAAGISMASVEQFMENRGIQQMIETICLSGQRVSEIVNNMLSFARKDDANVSSHYLEKIMDKAIKLAATHYDLKKEYDFRRIEIIKDYTDTPAPVPCQAGKIQQVLLNILTNGAQAMQGAQTPDAAFIIRTYIDSDRDMACMEIQDNGPGMDEKIRKHVFDPFFTTKPEGVGTGLGLSVSYFIITENHNGEMTVESNPGSGANFIIRLPLFTDRRHS